MEQRPHVAEQRSSARGSSAAVGSSRITSGASRRKARASATRCHCPTERSRPSAFSQDSTVRYPCGNPSRKPAAPARGAAALAAGSSSADSGSPSDALQRGQLVAHEVLEDHRHRAMDVRGLQLARVDAVPLGRALGGQVQRSDELGEGGHAGPVLAYERDDLTGSDAQIRVGDGRSVSAGVGVAHPAQDELAPVRRGSTAKPNSVRTARRVRYSVGPRGAGWAPAAARCSPASPRRSARYVPPAVIAAEPVLASLPESRT
jgi:hypothetical protein